MSANSIIILRGLNMADCHACDKRAFCCWATLVLGNEKMSGSMFRGFESELCVCVCGVAACLLTSAHSSCSFILTNCNAASPVTTIFKYLRRPVVWSCQLYLPWVDNVSVRFRYPPSSRQTSHDEGKEWLRSHSTGGLQDTGSQSPLSPPGASCTTTGKYHYSNLRESLLIYLL